MYYVDKLNVSRVKVKKEYQLDMHIIAGETYHVWSA